MSFKDLLNNSVLLRTDNTTCVAYNNHQRGITSLQISTIAEQIWESCLQKTSH
ncbi:hypothetical protein C2G38_99176 [Gigaspora rosea]|uniref:Uncharacterized protein n=1 Tax=Gigaspora rosea TaxID=44941 RepID=A0A397W0B5_9GLOM|nr:hypothetical protein C2G38_99176 [Gigaspora rosea]